MFLIILSNLFPKLWYGKILMIYFDQSIEYIPLLNDGQNEFMKMKHFRKEVKHILDILEIEKDFM